MTELTAHNVERSLNTIRDRMDSILEDDAAGVLGRATAEVVRSASDHNESVRQRRKERPIRPWGFRIHPDQPLRFKETECDGFRIRVDVFSRVYWRTLPGVTPSELSTAMRVWCLDEHVYFREEWDAKRPQERITRAPRARVMLRLHFDLAERDQPGPGHHVQVGGKQHTGEFHWFLETLSVPRLLHMPLDLVLAVEFVAATFYTTSYKKIRREHMLA